MLDLTVIILTKDEKIHIKRCLDHLKSLTDKIIVVDSQSSDGTQEIAKAMGAEVIEHNWLGNQAAQFNWALDNLKIDTKWILRLDADEYLLPELINEIKRNLSNIPDNVSGIFLKRRHIFLNKWMRGGIYPVKLLRLFRYGHGKYEQRLMDEHIVLSNGDSIEFENDFCDHNLNNLSWFCKKHVDYAVREAAEMLDIKYQISGHVENTDNFTSQAKDKKTKKQKYAKQPLFWRSFAYFLYRYILKGGWRDGKEGFIFTFLQGWWYRTLVDAKIFEIELKAKKNPSKIKQLLAEDYSILL